MPKTHTETEEERLISLPLLGQSQSLVPNKKQLSYWGSIRNPRTVEAAFRLPVPLALDLVLMGRGQEEPADRLCITGD